MEHRIYKEENSTWDQAQGGKGGTNRRGKRRQMHLHGAGQRVKWWRLTGGRCGRRPGGQRFALGVWW